MMTGTSGRPEHARPAIVHCGACGAEIEQQDTDLWETGGDTADERRHCTEARNHLHAPDQLEDNQLADFLQEVPGHRNDLGDWCPRSGEYSADGTCPLYCREADDLAGFDAGRDEDDDEDGGWPDTLAELRERQ